jgi:pimeloyl-ACP methyl ester carboxylesterase
MVREAYVEVSDRRQRYLDAGAGWPVILLHPFPLHADFWRPQLERITRGWRCLAPDLRGFGPAAVPPERRTLDDLAEGVAGFMDGLEIEKAVIGGLSMGGYVAMAFYRMAPERFTGLVLANTRAGAEPPEGRPARDAMIALVQAQGPRAVADQMMSKLLGQTSQRARQHLAPLVRRLIETNTAEAIAAAIQAIRDRPDSMPTLERCAVPALVITGEEDTIIPVAESEAMARTIPRAQLVVLGAAGHLSSLEVPDDFSEALGNFLLANL